MHCKEIKNCTVTATALKFIAYKIILKMRDEEYPLIREQDEGSNNVIILLPRFNIGNMFSVTYNQLLKSNTNLKKGLI